MAQFSGRMVPERVQRFWAALQRGEFIGDAAAGLGQALRVVVVVLWWLFAGSSPLWWRLVVLALGAFMVRGVAEDIIPG